MSNTLNNQTVEWNRINWRKLEVAVYKLQKRIFQASLRGDTSSVRRLQKTLMRSWSGKALSVRKITQDNQGKKTAGVDGIKSLTPKARQNLVLSLNINNKVSATRRVWIPKSNGDKRPLGIPTMHDRATQALAKAETLLDHASKKIVRHIKVKGTASPFDGNLKYWSSRRGEHPLVPTRVAKLLKEQKGKCAHCELYFREDDLIEIDHIIPKSLGGKDRYGNLQALHRHCHDSKTANDIRASRLGEVTPAEDEELSVW